MSELSPLLISGFSSIQTGFLETSSLTTGTGEDIRYVEITITAVDTDKAIVIFTGGAGPNAGTALSDYDGGTTISKVTCRLTNSTTVRFSSVYATSVIAGRWYVYEGT